MKRKIFKNVLKPTFIKQNDLLNKNISPLSNVALTNQRPAIRTLTNESEGIDHVTFVGPITADLVEQQSSILENSKSNELKL